MSSASNRTVWLLAGIGSICIHTGLLAALLLFPAPHHSQRTETSVALQSVPAQMADGVRSSAVLPRVRPEAAAAAQGDASKRILKAHADKTESEELAAVVGRSTDTLKPADTGRIATTATERSLVNAAEAERILLEAKAEASPQAERPPDFDSETSAAAAFKPAVAVPAERSSPLIDAAGSKAAANTVDAKVAATALASAAAFSPQAPPAGRPATYVERRPNATGPLTGKMTAPIAAPTERFVAPAPSAAQQIRVGAAAKGGAIALAMEGKMAFAVPTSVRTTAPPVSSSTDIGPEAGPADQPAPTAGAASSELPPVVELVEPQQTDTAKAVALATPLKPPVRTRQIDPYEQVLDYIAAYRGSDCFLALPSPGNKALIEIDGFAVAEEETARFTKELIQLTGIAVEPNSHAISPDQCGALAFARKLSSYPNPGLDLQLDASSIKSGSSLSGKIGKVRRKMLYLIVIDDEGKVQEIENFYRTEAGAIGFEAPMTLTNGRVETVQLLIGIASDSELHTLASHEGRQAAHYFEALAEEITRANMGIEFGFTYFFVR